MIDGDDHTDLPRENEKHARCGITLAADIGVLRIRLGLKQGLQGLKLPPRWSRGNTHKTTLNSESYMERVMAIEPTFSAWEADVLPLNYTRPCNCTRMDKAGFYCIAAPSQRRSRGPAGAATGMPIDHRGWAVWSNARQRSAMRGPFAGCRRSGAMSASGRTTNATLSRRGTSIPSLRAYPEAGRTSHPSNVD